MTISQPDRLFIGNMPCGIVYADRKVEEHGDFRRLAFISYDTLELDMEDKVPADCKAFIEQQHEKYLACTGQVYQVANQTMILGSERWLLPGNHVMYKGEKVEIVKCVMRDVASGLHAFDLKKEDGTVFMGYASLMKKMD